MPVTDAQIAALAEARCDDPFSILGLHPGPAGLEMRAWLRNAGAAWLQPADGSEPVPLIRRGDSAMFEATLPGHRERFAYHLLVDNGDGTRHHCGDAYSFGLQLAEWDLARFAEGRHHDLGDLLGAHCTLVDGIEGVRFAVWAPNATAVSVIGDWNGFDGRWHPMRRRHPFGVWELFVPGIGAGQRYKFEVHGPHGSVKAKADPFARACEVPPATASLVAAPSHHQWRDGHWLSERSRADWWHRPMAIYEVHVGSWQHGADGRQLTFRELAPRLIEHCRNMNFTHVEFLPLNAHPFEGSWGYQASGWYAPNSRHGDGDDLRFLIDELHRAGIGVLVDVVPAHFPKDDFALANFDGTPTFEYGDPREGEHREWGTLVFNLRRPEVRNFLLASILHLLRDYHVDGVRVDAVSAMLYRDYNRQPGEWVANEDGSNANWDAVSFLRELNTTIHREYPGVVTIAEESTAWEGTTAPVEWEGLGFDLKWNMGWMHDTLRYLGQDPIMRPGCHDWITFHQWYAYDEKWVLPLSHDEVVHGKGSLIDKMAGDWFQRRASLRLLIGYQCAIPGRPLLFQGGEIGQGREWSWRRSVDWHEGDEPERRALCTFVAEAFASYRSEVALYGRDDEREGFRWVDCENRKESVLAFLRRAPAGPDILVVCNFTPIVRHNYPLGVTVAGQWTVLLNSDEVRFGGSGAGPTGVVRTNDGEQLADWPAVLRIDLPPLAIVFLRAEG